MGASARTFRSRCAVDEASSTYVWYLLSERGLAHHDAAFLVHGVGPPLAKGGGRKYEPAATKATGTLPRWEQLTARGEGVRKGRDATALHTSTRCCATGSARSSVTDVAKQDEDRWCTPRGRGLWSGAAPTQGNTSPGRLTPTVPVAVVCTPASISRSLQRRHLSPWMSEYKKKLHARVLMRLGDTLPRQKAR